MITELPQNWGNRLLEGTNKTWVYRSQEKRAVSPQKTESDLPVSVQESPVEAWGDSLASGQTTGRAHSHTLQKKIGLKIH